ncbi:MAG: ArsR family transcriptional regulator [Comamonadaceae bacterium]|nr:MAG: ArsR family transcriptional regulator [Comamonadaceae bacterium]
MRAFKHPDANEFMLERVLYALSDPVRLDIVRTLGSVAAASCGELDGGRPKSTMSHHFRVLRESGLVHTECAGTTHMNSLRRAELERRFPGLMDAILGLQAVRAADAEALS